MAYDFDRNFEAKQNRRMAAEDRYLGRMEKKTAEATTLVGILIRDGVEVAYVNLRDRLGNLTGRIKEFTGFAATGHAVEYLIRNHYV